MLGVYICATKCMLFFGVASLLWITYRNACVLWCEYYLRSPCMLVQEYAALFSNLVKTVTALDKSDGYEEIFWTVVTNRRWEAQGIVWIRVKMAEGKLGCKYEFCRCKKSSE